MLSCPARNRALPSALLLGLALLAMPAAAAAQTVVHVGPVDSIKVWTDYARATFAQSTSDSVTDQNYHAFEAVGLIGRRLMRQIGRGRLLEARGVRQAIDSLGLVTEAAEDPLWPGFALLMVHNSSRPDADAVGFLYWFRGSDLRMQGVVFRGGHHPSMRVWRSNKGGTPYECAVLDQTREGLPHMTLLGMSQDGLAWDLEQDEESLPMFAQPGTASFVDVNDDGIPEIQTWTHGPTDSLFTECMDCPKLLTERLYVESAGEPPVFELEDERLLPTPYATLVYFVRLLIDGKLTQAERLVRDPARVRQAIAAGWNKRVVKHAWTVEAREANQAWPRMLQVRFQGPSGAKRYEVTFAKQNSHWVIQDWAEPQPAKTIYPSVKVPPVRRPPAGKTKKPGATPRPQGR
jgi:hypothetical protein